MMKWLIAAAAAVVLGGIVYLQLHSTKTMYVNGLALYTKLPNREYVLESDCYIFKFKAKDSSWPLIGSHVSVPALPQDVSQAHVGEDLPDVRLLDVLHVGDHFRIASVRMDQSRKETTVTFEIVLADETTRKFPRLDAFWIMDHAPEKAGKAPTILPSFAVMLGKE